MRIRLTVAVNGIDGPTWYAGETHDAPDAFARDLVTRRWAVAVDTPDDPAGEAAAPCYATHDAPITARDPVAPKRSKR